MRYKRTNVEDKATHVQLEAVNRQYDVMKDMLGEAGYEVRNGKNTFSKLAGNDGLSDYLHHRVERAVPYLGIGMGAQSFHPGHTLSYNG
jgi:oxygen-independent coproporphyrinogen-3 oxidase